MKSTLGRQCAVIETTIRHIEERFEENINECRSVLMSNLKREDELRMRLENLRREAARLGLGTELTATVQVPSHENPIRTPIDSGDFEEDLKDLVTLRDRLLRNIELSELMHPS
jgi:hypothetical protein